MVESVKLARLKKFSSREFCISFSDSNCCLNFELIYVTDPENNKGSIREQSSYWDGSKKHDFINNITNIIHGK